MSTAAILCGHSIFTEGVFVTELSGNAGESQFGELRGLGKIAGSRTIDIY